MTLNRRVFIKQSGAALALTVGLIFMQGCRPPVSRASNQAPAVEDAKEQDPLCRIWFDRPARDFKQSLPLGNGRIGAMVFGGVGEERIVLNESSVWAGAHFDADRPDAHKYLPEMRRLLLEGKVIEAEKLGKEKFSPINPSTASESVTYFGSYQTLGNLRLKFDDKPSFPELRCASKHVADVSSEAVEYSMDGDDQTKWRVKHFKQPVIWFLDAGVNGATPKEYRLTPAHDAPESDPKNWELEASNDGIKWTTLDSRKNEVFAKRLETRVFRIAKPVKSRFFRVTFAPNPENPYFQVAGIALDGIRPKPVVMPAPKGYARSLDLRSGLAKVVYEDGGAVFTREHFISAPDEVFVSRLTADRAGALSFAITLDRPERFETIASGYELLMTGTLSDGMGGKGISYAGRLRALVKGGSVKVSGNTLIVDKADEVLLLFVAATDFKGFAGRQLGDPVAATKRDLDQAAEKSFADLRAAQKADHEQYFSRVELNLPATANSALPTMERLAGFTQGKADPALAALYFNFGRYLLISSSRPGGFPGNLQGIWAEEILTPWNGDWHFDINVQMNYWPAEVCNLSELHEPLHKLIGALVEPGRKTAKEYFNARGWFAPVASNPWLQTTPIKWRRWGATPLSMSAWLCQHLWEHYAFTLDREFLAWAYPIMKEAVLFHLDTLFEEPKHKWLVTGPSVSPENRYFLPDGTATFVCMAPTIDMQSLRELFGNTAQAAEILGLDNDLRREILEKRSRLAPNQIGPDGRLQEWLEPYREHQPTHRHTAHLYGLHPYYEITPRGTPELAAAARKSLEARGDESVGWGYAWHVNFWARLGDGDRAFEQLQRLLLLADEKVGDYDAVIRGGGTLANLFSSCPPFQIDANFGGCAGIAEMLLQSHAGEIELLPALPKAWPSGSVKGLRARGGCTVDIEWDQGKVTKYRIASAKPREVNVRVNGELVAAKTEPSGPRRK